MCPNIPLVPRLMPATVSRYESGRQIESCENASALSHCLSGVCCSRLFFSHRQIVFSWHDINSKYYLPQRSSTQKNSRSMPHSKKRPALDDTQLLHMLLDKEEMGLSWDRWNAHQKRSDSPVMRNRLQALSRRLLSDWPPAIPLQSCSGAYLRPLDVFDKLVQQYCKQGLFFVSPSAPRQDVLLFKLAADNRPIFDRPNEALFMQPLSVRNPQSVGHVVTFCIAAVPEKDHVLDSVAVEVGLPELFRILGQRQVLYEDKLMRCDFVFTADWVTHVLELGIELPNASQSDSQTCWCCYVAFEERTNTWRRDPFEFHFVNRHDNSTFCRRTVAATACPPRSDVTVGGTAALDCSPTLFHVCTLCCPQNSSKNGSRSCWPLHWSARGARTQVST